jgi:hypothetical protein
MHRMEITSTRLVLYAYVGFFRMISLLMFIFPLKLVPLRPITGLHFPAPFSLFVFFLPFTGSNLHVS